MGLTGYAIRLVICDNAEFCRPHDKIYTNLTIRIGGVRMVPKSFLHASNSLEENDMNHSALPTVVTVRSNIAEQSIGISEEG